MKSRLLVLLTPALVQPLVMWLCLRVFEWRILMSALAGALMAVLMTLAVLFLTARQSRQREAGGPRRDG